MDKDVVYDVALEFPIDTVFTTLFDTYNKLRNALVSKYGKPVINYYVKPSPLASEKMIKAINDGDTKYLSVWTMKEGEIFLEIRPSTGSPFGYENNIHIALYYTDKKGNVLKKNDSMGDL